MYKSFGTLIIAAMFAALPTSPSFAQTNAAPKPSPEVVLENADVQVRVIAYAPGTVSPIGKHPHRIIYVVGGPVTFKWIFEDGHTTVESHQSGDVIWQEPATYSLSNAGTNTAHILMINLKK